MLFPYSDTFMTEKEVKYLFAKMKQKYKSKFDLTKKDELVVRYQASDYQYICITNFFTERQRMNCNVRNQLSPYNWFQIPENKQLIFNSLTSSGKELTPQNIREEIWKSTKECTLFKNTVVYSLCKLFHAKRYLDISAGWGDRLIGAIAASVDEYVGFDPNKELKSGHDKIIELFDAHAARIHYAPFEESSDIIPSNHFDFILSSPPYFDYEEYSKDKSQSYLRYPNQSQWFNNFLCKSLSISCNALTNYGNLIIHIDNTNNNDILKSMIDHVESIDDMYFIGKIYVEGNSKKFRPMFHFKKIQNKMKAPKLKYNIVNNPILEKVFRENPLWETADGASDAGASDAAIMDVPTDLDEKIYFMKLNNSIVFYNQNITFTTKEIRMMQKYDNKTLFQKHNNKIEVVCMIERYELAEWVYNQIYVTTREITIDEIKRSDFGIKWAKQLARTKVEYYNIDNYLTKRNKYIGVFDCGYLSDIDEK